MNGNLSASTGATAVLDQSFEYHFATGRLLGTGDSVMDVAAVYSREANSEFISQTRWKTGAAIDPAPALTKAFFGRTRDSEGRLGTVQNWHVGEPPLAGVATFGYDARDRRISETRTGAAGWQFGYNDRNEVTSASRKDAAGASLAGWQFGYVFDAIGNRLSSSGGGREGSYTPNALNQYTTATVAGKADIVGEVTTPDTKTWVRRLDPPPVEPAQAATEAAVQGTPSTQTPAWFHHRVTADNSTGPVDLEVNVKSVRKDGGEFQNEQTGRIRIPKAQETFVHDDDGNLLSDSLWNITWDGENRMKEMESKLPAGGPGHCKVQYAYDHASRMTRRETWKWIGNQWVSQKRDHFLWQGWNIIAELESLPANYATAPTLVRRNLWGLDLSGSIQGAGGVGGLLAVQNLTGTPQTTTPAYDGNGNILAYHELSSGTKVVAFTYGPFGEPLSATGPAAANYPFGFSTKYTDSVTGLVLYQLRAYKPETGRWMSRDPIGEWGGLNLQAIVGNNNITKFDILGLAEVDCMACNNCKGKNDISKEINAKISPYNGKPEDLYKTFGVNKLLSFPPKAIIEDWADNHKESTSPVNSKYRGSLIAGFINNCVKVCGKCIGSDKLGHMLQQGYEYYKLDAKFGIGAGEAYGKWVEGVGEINDPNYQQFQQAIMSMGMGFGGYGLNASGVISHADLAANKKGNALYNDIAKGQFKSICDYIKDDTLDEDSNHNDYSQYIIEIVIRNKTQDILDIMNKILMK